MIKSLSAFIYKINLLLKTELDKYNINLAFVVKLIFALVFIVSGIYLFVELTKTLNTEALVAYDKNITDYFIGSRTPALSNYFVFITHLGDIYGYLIILVIGAFLTVTRFKQWEYLLQIISVLMLSACSTFILKRVISREKPAIEHMVSINTLSYPSGHTMSAMAFYGFLIYLIYKNNISPFVKFPAILLLCILILSMGISRIYLGVHFPSDVLAGFIAGAVCVVFCIVVFKGIDFYNGVSKY